MSSGLQPGQPTCAGEDDQQQAIVFLSNGASYGEPGAMVERIETHISIVFLVGDLAYKLKRAVRYSYLDYSSAALREKYCQAELTLNRRTAPELYLRVRAITHEPDGSLTFDGAGMAVDWVLEMRRFGQNDLFDHLADLGKLTPEMMRELTDGIAEFHKSAQQVIAGGGYAGIKEAITVNAINLIDSCPPLDRTLVDQVNAASMAEFALVGPLLDRRQVAAKIRRCHGDLHLRNICLVNGHPTPFDCIEFNDAFSCIDVLYDLAFLLMDLLHRGFRDLANIVFNRYLDRTGDVSGLPALPLFMSVRAVIRAHVLVAQEQQHHSQEVAAQAQSYLAVGRELLNLQKPCLIVIGGLSGTGKSTLAAGLAPEFWPAPGARVIRSDVVRKTLCGVAPETRLPVPAYGRAVTERVYIELHDQAIQVLAAGYTAIIDATFLSPNDRRGVATIAERAGVPFFGFWLEAPRNILEQRLKARHKDASDADATVLGRQALLEVGTVDWMRIDAVEPIDIQLTSMRRIFRNIKTREIPCT